MHTHPLKLRGSTLPLLGMLACALGGLGSASGSRAQEPSSTWTQAKLEATSLEIQKDVEKLRGVKFKADVPVKLSSKEQFVAYVLELTEREEPKPKRDADEAIQKMLGLIPPDMDLLAESIRLLEGQAAGFYDPSSKTFYLMEDCPVVLAKTVLAHELGHAIDDQLYDLGAMMKRVAERTDELQAYRGVFEGSATVVGNQWLFKNMKLTDLLSVTGLQEKLTASLASSPTILWRPLLAGYLTGAAFLSRTEDVMTGQKAVPAPADLEQAFRSPPRSTEQILHPEKYWDASKRDDPVTVKQACKDLPEGWALLRRDVMGEGAIAIWSIAPAEREKAGAKVSATMEFTCPVAEGWGGDEVVLLGKGDKARVLRWLSSWDTERDAAEFYGAASMLLPVLRTTLTELAGGKVLQVVAEIRYGSTLEVVIELGFGAKRSELQEVVAAISDR